MLLYQWLKIQKSLGVHHPITRGGGGSFLVADKLFISTKLGGALKISNFIIYLYRTLSSWHKYLLPEIINKNIYYPKLYIKKELQPPPPVDWMVALLTHSVGLKYIR